MECNAIEVDFPLIHVTLRTQKRWGKGFYTSTPKNEILLRNR